jgi:hypothetical protein
MEVVPTKMEGETTTARISNLSNNISFVSMMKRE